MAEVGTVYMDVEFNGSKVARDLTARTTVAAAAASTAMVKTFDQRLAKFGGVLEQHGKKMTTHLTAPIVAGGVLATREFNGFESSMTKISSLVGESREQVRAWSGDVRRIGIDFGVGAQAAAEGMYFITSSGIRGAEAIDTLDRSAKASAVGLGQVSTIADLTTSALNAYSGTGLTAARATDVLVAAVRTGKSEPDELAASMGRVLPVAANMGVTFDQVAAAMASMSLTGTNADEAATQLRGIFNALLKPSKQAEAALANVGLSAEQLRADIAEKGLLPVLGQLVTALGDDAAATALVFDDVRALTGVMNVLGKNAKQTEQIFREVAAANGDLDRAFEITSETAEFKLNKSLAKAKDSLIELGATASPVITTIGDALATAAHTFTSFPEPLQKITAGVIGLVAIAGPAAYGIGKISSGISTVVKVSEKILDRSITRGVESIGTSADVSATKVGGLTSKLTAAGIVVTGLAVAYGLWVGKMDEARDAADALDKQIDAKVSGGGIEDAAKTIGKINGQIGDLKKELDGYRTTFNPFDILDVDYIKGLEIQGEQLERSGVEIAKQIGLAKRLAPAIGKTADETYRWLEAEKAAGRTYAIAEDALVGYMNAQKETGDATVVAANKVEASRAKIEGITQTVFAALDGQRAYADATRGVTDAYRGVEQANRRVIDANQAYTASLRRVKDAAREVTDAKRELDEALNGPSEDDQISLERARIRVEQSRKALGGKFEDPLDRRSAELDVRQAEADLRRIEAELAGQIGEKQAALEVANDNLQNANADLAAASRDVSEAQHEAAAATEGVTKANELAARAVFDLHGKQQDLADMFKNSPGDIAPWVESLKSLQQLYPEVAGVLQGYIDKVEALQNIQTNADPVAFAQKYIDLSGGPLNPAQATEMILRYASSVVGRAVTDLEEAKAIILGQIPGRAYGGPVTAGRPYGVNELGLPELFEADGHQYLIPTMDGNITAAGEFGQAGGVHIGHLEVHGGDQPELASWHMQRRLRQISRGSRNVGRR